MSWTFYGSSSVTPYRLVIPCVDLVRILSRHRSWAKHICLVRFEAHLFKHKTHPREPAYRMEKVVMVNIRSGRAGRSSSGGFREPQVSMLSGRACVIVIPKDQLLRNVWT
eukprot:4395936-Amphidinium_carterae.1